MNPFKTQSHICGGSGTVRYLAREKDEKGKVLPIRRPFPRDPKRSRKDHDKSFVKALQESREGSKNLEDILRGHPFSGSLTGLPPRRLKATYTTQPPQTCWCVDLAKAKADRKARLAATEKAAQEAKQDAFVERIATALAVPGLEGP